MAKKQNVFVLNKRSGKSSIQFL